MRQSFVEYHLFECLREFDAQNRPLDGYLRDYFYRHRALGAHDRRQMSERCYRLVRWRGLLDRFVEGVPNWERRNSVLMAISPEELIDESLPLHIRWSVPKWLMDRLVMAFGQEGAQILCRVSNQQAPTTLRVNGLKTSRQQLIEQWAGRFEMEPCHFAPMGIRLHQRATLMGLEEFKAGLFEIQDEGSQLVAQLVDVKPGQQVLDYCAGAGGKSLAMAAVMQGKGQLFLHDVRQWALLEARRRLRRAGAQNSQIITGERQLKLLKGRMDWVLVDAPCSGTGTLRRNPDAKWRLEPEAIERLVSQQRQIVGAALPYLKPGGRLVYATCSLLPEENQEQLTYFSSSYGLQPIGLPFQCQPEPGGMDGFFAAVLTR
jgi:16S rRNA (cytosine967-C5)-methyltransferase